MNRKNAEILIGILLLLTMVVISYYLHEIDRKLTYTQDLDTIDRKLDIIISGNRVMLEEQQKPVFINN